MGNSYFRFKQFTIHQKNTAMKVGVDAVLLGAWANPSNASDILDIGTGTGLLSLMLAQKSDARIVAIEIDEDAYRQAIENVNASEWKSRIEVYKISLQEFVQKENSKFDFIICNPPFFNSSLLSPDQNRTLARHDLSMNLNDLFSSVRHFLSLTGRFTMIYQFDRKKDVLSIAGENQLFPFRILDVKGNENKLPNRVIIEFGRQQQLCDQRELMVRNAKTLDYTSEYKELTREYYLNF